jgi:hypothetical protein
VEAGEPVHAASKRLASSIVLAAGGLALSLLVFPAAASAAGASNVVPMTSFTTTSTQCSGPTYLPVANPALRQAYAELDALIGSAPGAGPYPPTFSSCAPLPSAAAPVVGSASGSSVTSPNGSATVSAQAVGNQLVEESASVSTTLSASLTLTSPAPSVTFSIPYTTSGLSQSGNEDPFALVSFTAATGLVACVDGSYGLWSNPPGQDDLASPLGASAGTATVQVFCPDGSELAPGSVGAGVNLLANVYSDNGQAAEASADIALHDVTATINS